MYPRPYDQDVVAIDDATDAALERQLQEWVTMGMRELLHYLWKQAEFHRWCVEHGRV